MEKIKDFWSNKTEEEKRKIVVYSVAGFVAVLLFVGVFLLTRKEDKQTVAEMSNPDAKEAQKYNSRTEANQLGKKDSASMNTAMDGIFGSSSTTDQNSSETYSDNSSYSQPSYSEPTYTQPNYNNNNSGSSGSSGGGGGKNYNSHSTYGDYSMWQAEEPKNNSIEYTEVKNYPTKKQPKNSSSNSSQAQEDFSTYSAPSFGGKEKNLSQGKRIRAKMVSTGYATSGRSLSFVLLEPIAIGGEQAKKGQVITGNAIVQGERLLVKFGTVKVNGKTLPANAFLLGYDGEEGLPVRGSASNGNGAGDIIRDEAQNQVSRIPVVGGLINRAGNSGSRSSESKIQLPNNVECSIMFN